MASRIERARVEFRTTLTSRQQGGVRALAWLSAVLVVGLAVTGLWQFFLHESDPSWFGYEPGLGVKPRASPSTGVADLHGLLGGAAGAVALLGGGWYAYKVAFAVPRLAVQALVLVTFGLVTGSLVRFNAVRLGGRDYEDAGRGYWQLFVNDVDVVITDKWDLGATAIRLWTVSHVLTLPVLLAFAWVGLNRVGEPDR